MGLIFNLGIFFSFISVSHGENCGIKNSTQLSTQIQNCIAPLISQNCFDIFSPPKIYLKAAAQRPDFTKIFDGRQIIIIGENHSDMTLKEILTRQLADMKQAGVTAIALEFLSSTTDLSNVPDEEIKNNLLVSSSISWSMQPYVELIKEARRLGIKVYGINPPLKKGHSSPPAYDDFDKAARDEVLADFKRTNEDQNLFMALTIKNISAKQGSGKTVVLVGASHAGAYYDKTQNSNAKIPGNLIWLDVKESQISNLIYQKSSDSSRTSVYVPLPQGQLPGCGELEFQSMYTGIFKY